MNWSADFNQIGMDITSGHDEKLIRFGDFDLFIMVTAGLKLQNLSQKVLVCPISHEPSADFDQICMDITFGHDKKLNRFW